MEYEKPSLQYWTASELDEIEATMSGGGGYVSVYPGEVAYVYGFDYGDGVDTREIAEQERMYLSNMGYRTYLNTDQSASFAVGLSPLTRLSRMNSGVFVFNGHADGGSCQFRSSPSQSYLTAERNGGAYSRIRGISMASCKAAFFMGCSTATYRAGYGNLIESAVENGAKCAFGWNESVDTVTATQFRERLFYFLRHGYRVGDAAENAASEMPWFDSTRNYAISGSSDTVLFLGGRASVSPRLSRTVSLEADDVDGVLLKARDRFVRYRQFDNGDCVYVRFVEGMPTTHYLVLDQDGECVAESNDRFDAAALEEATRLADEKPSQAGEVHLMDDGAANVGVTLGDPFCLFALVDGEVRIVEVCIRERADGNGIVFRETTCVDKLSGNRIGYSTFLRDNYPGGGE